MIVAERKKMPEIVDIVKGHKKILVLGCGACVAVCLAGGEREVSIISSALRMSSKLAGTDLEIEEMTIERQCENIFIEQAIEAIERNDAILSLGCGAGVQALADRFNKPVYPGLNTTFLGVLEEQGVWEEKCSACGECILHEYGGICPITRCAKRLLNGPCGGSTPECCEVREDLDCAWQLIYKRLKELGQLDRLKGITPPKNCEVALDGGYRKIIREDHRI